MGDAEKRGRYDRGEIDASGNERPRERYYRDFQEPGAETHSYSSNEGYADFMDEDVLREMFSRAAAERGFARAGRTHFTVLPIEFLEAVNGATKRITMPDGGTLDVVIPAGTRDKQVLRLRGKGGAGLGGGPAGDALVEVEVQPHKFFTRDGDDIRLELPISLPEAVLGAQARCPHAHRLGAHDRAQGGQ